MAVKKKTARKVGSAKAGAPARKAASRPARTAGASVGAVAVAGARRKTAPPAAAPGAPAPDKLIGKPAPGFELATPEGSVKLSDLRGRAVIVYFYPRDDTPGCTKEACGFNDRLPDFRAASAEVIGISRDSTASHGRFRDKFGLKFRLASDPEGKVLAAYGAWVQKSMYGRSYMGIDRSTFLIDRDGVVRGVWRGVKVPGHVEAVLAAAQAL